jgi:signal peptidase I
LTVWSPPLHGGDEVEGLPAVPDRQPASATRAALELPIVLVAACLVAFLMKTFVAQAFFIPSASMEPTLHGCTGCADDRVFVSKLSYRLHKPHRGDIVVFDCPPIMCAGKAPDKSNLVVKGVNGALEAIGIKQPSTDEFIKRVIGLPGETVDIHDNRVYIDGKLLDEPYLAEGVVTVPLIVKMPVKVGPGQLWVMGDNRSNSSDARVFGLIDQKHVVGRAFFKVWPIPHAAYL